jgi:hypothetical protein
MHISCVAGRRAEARVRIKHTSLASILWVRIFQLLCRCGLSHSLDDEDVVQVLKSKTAAAEDGA